MPIYEYRCKSCESEFEKLVSLSAAERGVDCPDCGSEQTERQISAFARPSGGGGGMTPDSCSNASSCGSGFS